jgi:hypothetical protein
LCTGPSVLTGRPSIQLEATLCAVLETAVMAATVADGQCPDQPSLYVFNGLFRLRLTILSVLVAPGN